MAEHDEDLVARIGDHVLGATIPARPDWASSLSAVAEYGPHSMHHYDGSCALCRLGHIPEAMPALVREVLDVLVGEHRLINPGDLQGSVAIVLGQLRDARAARDEALTVIQKLHEALLAIAASEPDTRSRQAKVMVEIARDALGVGRG